MCASCHTFAIITDYENEFLFDGIVNNLDLDLARTPRALNGVLNNVDCCLLDSLLIANYKLRDLSVLLRIINVLEKRVCSLNHTRSIHILTDLLHPLVNARYHAHSRHIIF